ncbi:hypothetical protein [Microbispora bryophytorum]|uniref:hypothetical protein n=1 Tax=Microbispora bryophytorum TaxID=1460882 RepID=UPI0033D4FDE2
MVMDLADGLPVPSPPAEYHLRAVGDADVPQRVAAHRVVVSPRGGDAYPVPTRLYRSLGFRECAKSLGYRHPA